MSALPPNTLLRMNIDKSMGFGLQKYAGIKDMNLAIELPSGLQPLPRAQGQKTPYRGGKKKLCAWGDVQRWPFRQKGMAKEKQPQGRRDARALRGGPTKKNYKKQTPNSLGTPIVPFHPVPAARTGTSVVTPSVCNLVAKMAMPIVAGNRKTEPETE